MELRLSISAAGVSPLSRSFSTKVIVSPSLRRRLGFSSLMTLPSPWPESLPTTNLLHILPEPPDLKLAAEIDQTPDPPDPPDLLRLLVIGDIIMVCSGSLPSYSNCVWGFVEWVDLVMIDPSWFGLVPIVSIVFGSPIVPFVGFLVASVRSVSAVCRLFSLTAVCRFFLLCHILAILSPRCDASFVPDAGNLIVSVRCLTAICRSRSDVTITIVAWSLFTFPLWQIGKKPHVMCISLVNLVRLDFQCPAFSLMESSFLPNSSLVFSGIVKGSSTSKEFPLGVETIAIKAAILAVSTIKIRHLNDSLSLVKLLKSRVLPTS